MDVSKLKLQYVTRIINSTIITDVVKLQALQTMMDVNSDDQDLVEELAMLKAPLDNQQLIKVNAEQVEVSETPSVTPADVLSAQISPASVSPPNLADQIRRQVADDKDSGDLIEEIRITAETMKFSFLRMKDHMANDDAIFDKAKDAQIKNEDGTKVANTSSSAFAAATCVGIIEMLLQICLAIVLGLAALYFV